MLKLVDQLAAAALLLVGAAHVAAASRAFTEPTEGRVWFLSAGLLGLVAGLANLARTRAGRPDRLMSLAALAGALAIVLMGVLLTLAGTDAATRGPAMVVFAVGGLAAAFSLRDLLRR
ncbi:hypothetical protein [Phenylobacterium sp.]|jgi:peptidoglycan/LPS O-acetylase OafA/YrhL|uniref:hypothetical protein n=1 Tax=Phenylobacterium sp. TaxID=1871053 RepID=UPI002F94576A